jgi:hypothetical protein
MTQNTADNERTFFVKYVGRFRWQPCYRASDGIEYPLRPFDKTSWKNAKDAVTLARQQWYDGLRAGGVHPLKQHMHDGTGPCDDVPEEMIKDVVGQEIKTYFGMRRLMDHIMWYFLVDAGMPQDAATRLVSSVWDTEMERLDLIKAYERATVAIAAIKSYVPIEHTHTSRGLGVAARRMFPPGP